MAAKKKTPRKTSATATEIRKREAEAARLEAGGRRQVLSIILFAIAAFLLFVVLIEGQNIWAKLHKFLFGVFGVCVYFWPILLGYIAVLCALNSYTGRIANKVWQSGVLIALVGAAIDVFSNHGEKVKFIEHLAGAYVNGMMSKGGGVLGGLIGYPLFLLFGKIGAGITICILIFVFFMIITGTTLLSLFLLIAKPVKKIKKRREEMAEHDLEMQASTFIKPAVGARFNIDIPIDGEEEKNFQEPVAKNSLTDKKKQLINTYRELQQEEKVAIEKSALKPKQKDGRDLKEPSVKAIIREKFESESQPDSGFENQQVGSGITVDSTYADYRYPPLSLLAEPKPEKSKNISEEMEATATRLVDTLRSFGVETRVIDISRGPAVTRYELQPSVGVKISKITNLADDIALNLATAGVRIEAPIPNKPAVGIEVPNKYTKVVNVREIIDTEQFRSMRSKLAVALGKDIAGNPVVADIAKMPHGLIAGATGSGKSVCINSIIISLLYKATPDDVKLLLIDPKVVELGIYNGIPHLLVPVVTNPRKASGALGWAVSEMEKRYKLFAENNVRDLKGYNKLAEKNEELTKMPHIVIIIDELADLMMTAPNEVEDSICRLAQKARAAGMHLIVATQRPSVDVITGLIKANIPTRIAFAVSSQVDSRTILDMGGAEKLLGKGDMLFYPVGSIKPKRVQGCFVSDEEVEAVVNYIKDNGASEYNQDVMIEIERQAAKEEAAKTGIETEEESDPMLVKAIECVVEAGQASTSLLQRRLRLGYARAARIMDEMEQRGIIGPYEGSKPRQILITKEQLIEMKAGNEI